MGEKNLKVGYIQNCPKTNQILFTVGFIDWSIVQKRRLNIICVFS